jgi:poly(hydroxyalkanoate) depolymerase family esterase
MARRRKAIGSRWLQQSLTAMTRTALRAGNRAVKQALRNAKTVQKAVLKKPARPASALPKAALSKPRPRRAPRTAAPSTRAPLRLLSPTPASAQRALTTRAPVRRAASTREPAEQPGWLSGIAVGPAGPRRFHVHRPPGVTRNERLPLLVMLHGCGQDAAGLAATSRMNRLADRERFLVLYPEQDRLANAHGCWNWFDTRSGRAQREAATIDAAIEQVCATQPVDRARMAIAGLSAGAGMAALLATRRPERFRAIAMHSGVAPGLAHSSTTALSAMRGRRKSMLPLPSAGSVFAWPPLLVIQGSADRVVAAENGAEAVRLWAAHAQARTGAPRTVQRGTRRAATLTDCRVGKRLVARLCVVEGLGHAWSGGAAGLAYSDPSGPDAARMIWRFAASQFARDESA